VTLNAAFPWGTEAGLSAIVREIELFEALNPGISVQTQSVPLGDLNRRWSEGWPAGSPDIAVYSKKVSVEGLSSIRTPAPWTGSLWALYANTRVTAEIPEWSEGPPAEWLDGNASLRDFEAVLQNLASNDVPGISVGAKFVWPFAAWVQHLALARDDSAATLMDDNLRLTPDAREALSRWQRWDRDGFIIPQWRALDWPASIQQVVDGKAAFVLLNGNLASSFPREAGEFIAVLPFPGGSSWTVGSVWFLAVPAGTETPGEAAQLFDFLLSEGVTDRLSRGLNVPFFAAGDGQGERVYASVTSDTNSPVMNRLGSAIR
jgi:ABC-type glycerol-3-phosphate transport system substrate-binding protein